MTDRARKEYNAYQNEWRRKNRDKVKQYNKNYWERKAQEKQKEQEAANQ